MTGRHRATARPLAQVALINLTKWCVAGSAFLALATTFPAHPAQAAAVKNLPVCASMCFNRAAPLDLTQVEDSRDDEVVCDAEFKHCTTEEA